MRNLFRSRRGSVAFATVVALVPAIGFLALGAEAGSWYVIRQQAQNAADAAAIAGALKLACDRGSVSCSDGEAYDYRSKQFAAQNSFCDGTDATAYPGSRCTTPPTGTTRTVAIVQPTTVRVQATITQTQSVQIARILGLTNVTIAARAIAEIQTPKEVCALGLGRYPSGSAMTLGGNVTNAGPGCALMSNDTVKYNGTPTFTGTGWSVNAADGCLPNGNQCNSPGVPYNYFAPAATNPLEILDSKSFNSRTGPTSKPCGNSGNITNGNTCTLTPNSAGGVYIGNYRVNGGGTLDFGPGTYFFRDANLDFSGTVRCSTCTTANGVTLILLGDSQLTINGGANVDLWASPVNSFDAHLNGVLIDDQSPNKNGNKVTINGGTTVKLGGVMYFPNVDVTYNGGTQSTNTSCSAVIANTLTMSGNSYLSTQGCAPGTVSMTQVVVLVPS